MEAIFSQRLKAARIMNGYSMDCLVEKMNPSVSKVAISKYESGKMLPDSTSLIALSNALNVSVDYFFRPFSFQIESFNFRKKSTLGKKELESIEKRIIDNLERYIDIENICAIENNFLSPFNEKILESEQVKKSANKLRELWNLGFDGINNVIELLESHSIKIIEIEENNKFDGLSTIVNNSIAVIVLNKKFAPERKRFTALHELAHLLFNFDEKFSDKEIERLCNLFASEFLLPANILYELLGKHRHDISYQELKAIQLEYGISIEALMYKAKESGIISEQRYKTFNILKNKDLNLKKYVETSLYKEEKSFRFIRLVYRALSDELITMSKAADLLCKSVIEVKQEFTLV